MSDAASGAARDRGLQAERTSLAWTRTSLALLANGALLMLRDLRNVPGRLGLAGVGFAVLIAVTAFVIGRRRQRVLTMWSPAQLAAPRREVYLLGFAVLVLIGTSMAIVTR